MQLELPAEYRDMFEEGEIFVSRWEGDSLMLMSKQSKESFVENLKEIEKGNDESREFARFLRAGITEVEYKDGVVDLPDFLSEMLKGDQRSFEFDSNNQSLVVK